LGKCARKKTRSRRCFRRKGGGRSMNAGELWFHDEQICLGLEQAATRLGANIQLNEAFQLQSARLGMLGTLDKAHVALSSQIQIVRHPLGAKMNLSSLADQCPFLVV